MAAKRGVHDYHLVLEDWEMKSNQLTNKSCGQKDKDDTKQEYDTMTRTYRHVINL